MDVGTLAVADVMVGSGGCKLVVGMAVLMAWAIRNQARKKAARDPQS